MITRSLIATLLLASVTAPAAAQGPAIRRPGFQGLAPEAVLGMRARLGLTKAQIDRLGALRREAVAERTAELSEMLELRSQLWAGDINRDEFAAKTEGRRAAVRSRAATRQNQVREVLTEEQREKLTELRRSAADRRMGEGRPGRGVWGPRRLIPGRSWEEGLRGRRLGPGRPGAEPWGPVEPPAPPEQ